MPASTRSSTSNPSTPVRSRIQDLDYVTPPSATVKTPSTPKSISVRDRRRFEGLDPTRASPTPEKGKGQERTKRRKIEQSIVCEGGLEETQTGCDAETKAGTEEVEVNGKEEIEELSEDFGDLEGSSEEEEEDQATKGKKRKRKTKGEKESKMIPLAARTKGLRMFLGAHVSMAKGIQNSVTNSVHIGGNAFALFLKSQRQWASKPLEPEHRDLFRQYCKEHGYDAASHVLPHGSYLVNLGQEEKAKAKQAYDAFLDDLKRCEELGIKLYNFHPGAAGSSSPESAATRIANHLNKALAATNTVMPVLENMCGAGSVIGSTFESLASIISQIDPKFRHRIGVCIDTCHSFAAGYDLRSPGSFTAVLDRFDHVIGMSYLKAMHINDSKAPLGSHRDLHANIGTGFLGLRAFHNVMNEPRFENLPLILETPIDKPDPSDPRGKKTLEDKAVWAREIKLLESLIGMDAESKEFKARERELSDQGKAERAKIQAQIDKKAESERKKGLKKKEKGQSTLSFAKRKGDDDCE